MISKSELRENNYYLFNSNKNTEFSFLAEIGQIKLNAENAFYVEFKSLPNEMLYVFNLEMDVMGVPLTSGNAQLIIDEGGYLDLIIDGYDVEVYIDSKQMQVEYVHQVQTINRILGNKELNLNLFK